MVVCQKGAAQLQAYHTATAGVSHVPRGLWKEVTGWRRSSSWGWSRGGKEKMGTPHTAPTTPHRWHRCLLLALTTFCGFPEAAHFGEPGCRVREELGWGGGSDASPSTSQRK